MKYKVTRTQLENSVIWNVIENHEFISVCKDRVYNEGKYLSTYVEPEGSPDFIGISDYHQDYVLRALQEGVYWISKYLLSLERKPSSNYWRDEMGKIKLQ